MGDRRIGLGALALAALMGGIPTFAGAQDLECETDADCGEGFECIFDEAASDPGCAPGAGDCGTIPIVETYSYCDEARLRCQLDEDCPNGLSCELEADDAPCAVSSDGQTTCPEPDPSMVEGECVFELVACEVDAECGPNEACTELGGSEDCGGSACLPGERCDVEPVCTSSPGPRACFPEFMPCRVNEECPGGWDCLEFAAVDDEPPPFWDVGDAQGACLPEGLVLAATGTKVDARGDFGGSDEGGGALVGSDADSAADSATAEPAPTQGASGDGSGSGLCSAPGAPRGRTPLVPLALLPAAALLLRRRQPRRPEPPRGT